ncbi:MAG: hypothetical protein PHO41_01885, partial [Eubacteriales bacterium]|nr:hypothetical protein [Eubacteriales bacterium]
LNEIIVSALSQLDRGHDGQTIDTWRSKLGHFANEAALDLAHCLQLRETEAAQVVNGEIDLDTLSRRCHKVLEVRQESAPVSFYPGSATNRIRIDGTDGEASVLYRYLPAPMQNPTDVPGIPEWCHGLIVTYVVGRERAGGDVSTQRSANIYFEIYNAGKRNLRRDSGELDAADIRNKWE